MESAVSLVRSVGAGHLGKSTLGDRNEVWLGLGHEEMCCVWGFTSRWGFLAGE